MRALVIDDSRAMRSILKQILRPIAFEVSEAGNGREGLERLRQLGKPDLVLVDWNMPEMDGLTFVRAVRADPSYAAVPLVMVTTETEMTRMAEALNAGANEYIMKPLNAEVVLGKLDLLGIAPGRPAREEEKETTADSFPLSPAAERPLKGLVVDDSRAMRMILAQLLKQFGFAVTAASDGRQGLERLQQAGPFDLALVDWNMPDMNGLEFLQAVQAAGCYGGLRLIVVTGEDEQNQMVLAREAGADDFLVKPPNQEALRSKLQRLALVPG